MALIPNGIEIDRFHPDASARDWLLDQLNLSRDVILIGLVARFDPMKDQGTFLRAAAFLAEKERSVHFIMVGKGMVLYNRDLIHLLDNNRLRGRVHLLGLRQDIPRIMAALDIHSSSSAFGEGFSNTIGEAMACGVPCVVTDVGDSARIVGDTGIDIPPKDPEALAGAWLKLLKMGEEKRKAMGDQARSRIVENFEIGMVVQRFEGFYEGLTISNER
jgi:glycosyltransferase involved in cell wall biosynthesis